MGIEKEERGFNTHRITLSFNNNKFVHQVKTVYNVWKLNQKEEDKEKVTVLTPVEKGMSSVTVEIRGLEKNEMYEATMSFMTDVGEEVWTFGPPNEGHTF